MKNILTTAILATSILLSSCQTEVKVPEKSKQEVVQEILVSNLMNVLNDTSSYQPMTFDSLRTITTNYFYRDLYKHKKDSIREYCRQMNLDYDQCDKLSDPIEYLWDSVNFAQPQLVDRYVLTHKFRAANKFGAIVINEVTLVVDSSFKVLQLD